MRTFLLTFCLGLCAVIATVPGFAQDYTGPEPPKADVPYLLHASNLVETESIEAHEEAKKNATLFWIEGTSSPARTPLAEPIFIIKTDKLSAEKLELYRFDVKKGRRELELKDRPGKNDARAIHLSYKEVGKNLWRVEAAEQLENGHYSLSPSGANVVFAFEVF